MNIPETSLEPFGFIGIPIPRVLYTCWLSRGETREELLEGLFAAVKISFEDAIKRWAVIRECRAKGIELPWSYSNLRLRTELRGGKDVSVIIDELEDGFFMTITFSIPYTKTRYGDSLMYDNPK